jgi:hypothetical protein
MPCLVSILALFFPRIAVVLVVLFSDYIGDACETTIWPLLGFFFMPLTVLAYAWAWHTGGGTVSGFPLAVVILAALFDLGLIGTSGASGRKHAERRRG